MKVLLYELFGKGEKIRYFSQDETRLGLKTIPGKRITVKGVKPLGSTQWKRKNFYLYGAIEIKTQDCYFYEFSHLDGQCFQEFINQLSEEFNGSINFLQLDNGTFHKNVDFKEFIIPIFQLSHSLELNPVERFWQQLKGDLQFGLIAKLFNNYSKKFRRFS